MKPQLWTPISYEWDNSKWIKEVHDPYEKCMGWGGGAPENGQHCSPYLKTSGTSSSSTSSSSTSSSSTSTSASTSTCIRPEDDTQGVGGGGLDSTFKRDPAFWSRRTKLVQALKDYSALHEQALSGGVGARFVLSHSWGGMNNRFLPLVSAMLFGMMTGRALLADLGDVLTYSLSASSNPLFQHAGFNWELRDKRELCVLSSPPALFLVTILHAPSVRRR